VSVPVSTLARVGVSVGGANGAAVTAIVSADLRRTGMIAPVGGGSGDYQATGEANGAGVSGQLTKRGGEVVFSQNFDGAGRSAAHEFSDAITKAVTGLPGFAASKLAFIGGNKELYLADIDGYGARPITKAVTGLPGFAASKLAFIGGNKELYLADIDGYGARPITHDHVISASPSLSRDGSKLAYTSYKSGYPDVYVIDLASGSRTRIAFFPGINSGPSFSPDGSQIALTLSKDGNPEIYTMSIGGGTPTRITRTRGAETSPSWSPDGRQLVYSSDDRGSPQLFISTSQGVGEMDHLITGNSFCTKPDWSPDGRSIAFTTRIGGIFQIGVFDVASRTGHLITGAGGEDPAWTRDSRHLIYANNGRILLLDTISRQSLPIDTGVNGSEPTVSR
jgi:TolB protein